jgi:hypothetical protein
MQRAVYYTKLKLLAHALDGKPVPNADDNEYSITLTPERIHSLPPNRSRRFTKDLPMADALALFMVREAKGDVAAVHLHMKEIGRYDVLVTKNKTNVADQLHMSKLLGLFYGNILERYADFDSFAEAALKIIIPFCMPKIRHRLAALDTGFLGELAVAINVLEIPEYAAWDTELRQGIAVDLKDILPELAGQPIHDSGDQIILGAARSAKLGLAQTIQSVLCSVKETVGRREELLSAGTEDSRDAIFQLMGWANALHRSNIRQDVFQRLECNADQHQKLDTLVANLGKAGAYWSGLNHLWQNITQPCQGGKEPFSLDAIMINASPIRIPLVKDVYKALEEFSSSSSGFRQPLGLSKQRLDTVWGNLVVQDTEEIPYHCELRLADALKERGITQGAMGVSRACCKFCTTALRGMNYQRRIDWKTSGEHDYVYMSVLPEDPGVRLFVEARVDACLKDLITTRLKQRGQSPARPMVANAEHAIKALDENVRMLKWWRK